NSQGNPNTVDTLAREFNRVLCKTYKGKQVNDVGFDSWSTNRLRHTMATRLVDGGADAQTVMNQGGWKSADAMAGYARVGSDVKRRGYEEAMRRAKEQQLY